MATPSTPAAFAGASSASRTEGFTRWRLAAGVVLGGQLAWLLAQSAGIFGRFALTSDFALFYQAAHQIAGGTLSPAGTIYRSAPFLTNHFELIIYPLSLLVLIDRSGMALLFAQDLATVGAELVVFWWVGDILSERWRAGPKGRHTVAAGALAVLALDPWIWWANAFDVHLEAFATLFVVLAARAFWHRRWTGWVWLVAALSCGTVEAAALLGLGLFLLCSGRDRWRRGAAVLAATAAWIVSWNAAGFDLGSQLGANYRYLTGSSNASLGAVAVGALRHPVTVTAHLSHRVRDLWRFLGGSGFLGIASAPGLAMVLAVFVPGALNLSPYVVAPQSSFQVLPLLLFVPVGSVLLCCWLVARRETWCRALALVAGLAAVVQVVVLSVLWIPQVPKEFLQVTPAGARVLTTIAARTPTGAEVVSSNGFVGRFAGRRWIYTDFGPAPGVAVRDEPVPVHARVLELVLSPRQGIYQGPPAVTAAAIAELRHRPGVSVLAQGAGITAFVWRAPPGVRTFPLYGYRGSD
jgi:hypothetical protein